MELIEKYKFIHNNGTLNIKKLWINYSSTHNIKITIPKNYIIDDIFIKSLLKDLKNLQIVTKSKNPIMLIFYFDEITNIVVDNQFILTKYHNKFLMINWNIEYEKQFIKFIWNENKILPIINTIMYNEKCFISKCYKNHLMVVSNYIKRIELILPHNKPFYNIPDGIILLIFNYYYFSYEKK